MKPSPFESQSATRAWNRHPGLAGVARPAEAKMAGQPALAVVGGRGSLVGGGALRGDG